ncbi:hypothetical protein L6164_019952 [Bauhinia variegata]|uniref:Uncharacterized protein n=1 Tax=Bauhinia variegata TaxID=167791 RepID=A0ACB9MTT2_BAUVA|nr:hypothetical protein L6164_019952 [Bauhinia variegata]
MGRQMPRCSMFHAHMVFFSLKTKEKKKYHFVTGENPKAKKPRSQSSATLARSTAKRIDENSHQANDSKGTKKKSSHAAADVDTSVNEKFGDESKKLFKRLWSEIAILKVVIEYSAKDGADPSKDPNGFHDFIKKSLHIDISTMQLMDKIRRLKKKYKNNARKGKKMPKIVNFQRHMTSKPLNYRRKFGALKELSGVVEQVKSNGKSRKDEKKGSRSRTVDSLKAELPPS